MKHIEVYNQEYLSIPSVHSFKKKQSHFQLEQENQKGWWHFILKLNLFLVFLISRYKYFANVYKMA